jgi:hypothetical protein
MMLDQEIFIIRAHRTGPDNITIQVRSESRGRLLGEYFATDLADVTLSFKNGGLTIEQKTRFQRAFAVG